MRSRRQRGGRWRDRGQSGAEYAAVFGVVATVIAAIVGLSLPEEEATGLKSAVCRVLHPLSGDESCATGDYAGDGKDGDGGPGGGDDSFVPNGDPFEPARCLLSQEQTKDSVIIQIVFVKISASETVKLQQWSDGSVTMERVSDTGGGVTASISAGIPGLKDWGGSAKLSGTFMASSGSGGQWLFNGNKTGDPQKDLELNLEDARQFAAALRQNDGCRYQSGYNPGANMLACQQDAAAKMPDIPPERAPDVDITKTSIEASGNANFGGKFKGGGKGGSGNGPKDLGKISGEVLNGTMTEDVVVMRHNNGPNAGKITFVYTFTVKGAGGFGAVATAERMQQVAVTYDAATYDQEETDGKEHRPEKLVVTSSQEAGEGVGFKAEAGANTGPVTIDVGGGGGSTNSRIHTESAELILDDDADSTTVEDWLRGNGNPAKNPLPSPTDAAEVPGPDASPLERLLYEKGKLSRLDYNANTDWWNASLGIGFGVAAGQFTLGFKLFGIEITHESKEQVITGDPTYATGPKNGGARPWVEWKNCTRTKPITD